MLRMTAKPQRSNAVDNRNLVEVDIKDYFKISFKNFKKKKNSDQQQRSVKLTHKS